MELPEIITQIVTNGVGVFIIAYFVYRDNKYTEKLLDLMNQLKELIEKLNDRLDDERKS